MSTRRYLRRLRIFPSFSLSFRWASASIRMNCGQFHQMRSSFAQPPQLELLKGAALCITHAGLNTALEALTQGVPMVALPIGYDQPGVAARIVYHGVGESLEIEKLTGEQLLEAM